MIELHAELRVLNYYYICSKESRRLLTCDLTSLGEPILPPYSTRAAPLVFLALLHLLIVYAI